MLILDPITFSLDLQLVVFIAIFADIATLAIAYDKAPYSKSPVKWNLPVMWGTAVVLGAILALGSWICLSSMNRWHPKVGGIMEDRGIRDSVLFLEIVLTENWLIFITRAGGQAFWRTTPSWQLVLAVLLVDVLATLFCVFGWFARGSGSNVMSSFATIARVWVFSLGIFSAMAGVYYLLANSPAFDRLMHGHIPCHGRRKDKSKEFELEDFGKSGIGMHSNLKLELSVRRSCRVTAHVPSA